MKLDLPILLASMMVGLAACSTPSQNAPERAGAGESVAEVKDRPPAEADQGAPDRRDVKRQAEAVRMEAYEVHESMFTDFGMSVRTNPEVKWGAEVEWMQVSVVAPGSSAARHQLGPGDRIVAIDGQLVTKLGRNGMLEVLFQRKAGDIVRLLVLGKDQAMPQFIDLTAGRLGSAK